MSRDNATSSRFTARSALGNASLESNENEFENPLSSVHFPPPRTPLNTIPDPSQYQKEIREFDFDSREILEATRAPHRSFDERIEALDNKNGNASSPNYAIPRVLYRHGKAKSEPNSAQSTPARSGARVSLGGGCTGGARVGQCNGGKGVSSISRVSRGISIANSDLSIEVPHFELDEDPSFWKDHNVQVLIRIRPLSTMERVSQGYGRCLRQESAQTLMWLGHPETRFTFDHVACKTISQENLFRFAGLPMVENCLSGYNSCMFAYGQTGSGKTYTMMGEIYEAEGRLNEDCGITPRIFEYIFSRIRTEEESRRDEKLKFSCKCSFLEIYNEQITDLLEPSSTNLQLREDLKKGVYVENLTECNVRTVNDVLKLLLQGAANRKMAATHMNSESSRSHSVFTCIIESHWEKDSMTHFRFARLNLVDLAGSERQKSSGAEGGRLKEAANINKSLSTLGLVIMSLVDLAHGKHRHVPYRDSRLTFLLQDSLGGNSKTMIIANVSPSICSANETLSTLKFAQRAKLIQNNAKVNEDASGDVPALQREIQQLKGQLSSLMKNQNFSRSLSTYASNLEESRLGGYSEKCELSGERITDNYHYQIQSVQSKKMKCMEATLVGALRREKKAKTALQKLEAEIEHMNRLALQREEDAQCTKMLLRFREEKIKQLELLVSGSLSAEKYLMEENKTLREEIQLFQAKLERNPELTRFHLENIRLFEQLQLFQNFYEQGERETMLAEISELRDQLLDLPEEKHRLSSRFENKDNDTLKELEDCRNMNSKLMGEVDDLQTELRKFLNCSQTAFDSATDSFSKDPEEFRQADKYSLVETISIRSDSGDEMASYAQADDGALGNKNDQNMSDTSVMQLIDSQKELMDARLLIEAMESEQVRLINELQLMKEQNDRYMDMLCNKDNVERQSMLNLESHCPELDDVEKRNQSPVVGSSDNMDREALRTKLGKLTKDLEETRLLNFQYQENHASQLSHQCQVEFVCEQVETETARAILHLQEEVAAVQSELQESLCCTTQENMRLKNTITVKEAEIRAISMEWEKAILELTNFLVDGSRSLKDASNQIESIVYSFPQVNVWINEHVEKAVKICIEKEETILLLQKSLEDAQEMLAEMEMKLSSLKGATIAFNEFQQQDGNESTEEAFQESILLKEKIDMVKMLERKVKLKEDHITEAEKRVDASFLVVKWLCDSHRHSQRDDTDRDIPTPRNHTPIAVGSDMVSEMKADMSALAVGDIKAQIELSRLGVRECKNAINAYFADTEVHIAALEAYILQLSSAGRDLVQDLMREIHEMRSEFLALKENHKNFQICAVKSLSLDAHNFLKFENQFHMLHQIKNVLAEIIGRLNIIHDCINTKVVMHLCPPKDEDLSEAGGLSADCSSLGSDFLTGSIDSGNNLDGSSCTCCCAKTTELDMKFQGRSVLESDDQELEKLKKLDEARTSDLRKEFGMAFDSFNKLYVQLTTILNEKNIGDCSYSEEITQVVPSLGLTMEIAEADCNNVSEKIDHARSFFNKFEETHATMKEADFMLNALVKANENAKQLNGMWRQAGEELIAERESLIDELERLKSSIDLKEGENELLQNHVHDSLADMENSMSLLEEYFLQMQREVEDTFKVLYSNVLSMGQEMLCFICNSRSSLENMCSEIMEKGFTLFVLYQCHIGKHMDQILNLGECGFNHFTQQGKHSVMNKTQSICLSGRDDIMITHKKGVSGEDQSEQVINLEDREVDLSHNNVIYENLSLKEELKRKEVLLEGLLFDLSLLQESASNTKDIKDETEKLILVLSQVRKELEMKTSQLDDILVQQRKLENRLTDTEKALFMSNSSLQQAKETIDTLSDQNSELRVLLKDLYLKNTEAEEGLEEQKEVVKGLEKEILHLTSLVEKDLLSSVEAVEEDLRKVTGERDKLLEEIFSLNDKLEMAYALADEKEAIAVEARQESEASKVYADQKEEEVKILEHSVEELECTINVLEKKVYEMDEEVERHRLIRDSLEVELQGLRQRLSTVENFTDIEDSTNANAEQAEDQISRQKHNRLLELQEAHHRIRFLEKERAELNKEIKQCKEYISELVLHSEAQASQYQQKYKILEAMVLEVKTDLSSSTSAAPALHTTEKSSTRTRGSSSPFRCIAGLVQQMNLEKDQELSTAKLRIEELEILVASQQKEVCMLNTRLAAAESMTHDVIRDLLGVKLDMTNYANLIDQHQVQKLVEASHQHTEEILSKEQEILNLKKQIDDLIEERESCISEINDKEADILAAQMTLEQLQERDQLLSAQNEMLKMDKTNLKRRVAELDEIVKSLLGTQSTQHKIQHTSKIKDNGLLRPSDADFTKRLAHSGKLLSQVNDELAQYRKSSSIHIHEKTYGQGSEARHRRQRD